MNMYNSVPNVPILAIFFGGWEMFLVAPYFAKVKGLILDIGACPESFRGWSLELGHSCGISSLSPPTPSNFDGRWISILHFGQCHLETSNIQHRTPNIEFA